ncbi:MAG: MBL fold metallo-hydrolase [Deltaproteobacteria bacterium]|nr:MBL fold metallo-hydrolase [Deltaproteobacteria bacterium]
MNVGQGDAILIDQGETEVLIDGGRKSPGTVEYLSYYVDDELDIMVATHPHDDHMGGLVEVLEAFEVGRIYHNGQESKGRFYKEFMDAINQEEAEISVVRLGDTIEAGDLIFTVLNPATLADTVNNNSIVLLLSYGAIDFLFAGDAEKNAEARMLAQKAVPVPEVEVLKVGHHGATTSSSPLFLQVIRPVVAIVMAKHTHDETIENLTRIGAEVYVTDSSGTIVIDCDGNGFTVRCERESLFSPDSPPAITSLTVDR